MSLLCQGITLSGNKCNRKTKGCKYCFQHRQKHYMQEKPEECPVCRESLTNQRSALRCGHWVHSNCIIQSAKAECPLCRTQLALGKRMMKSIDRIAKRRAAEDMAEEEEELQADLQANIANWISPSLQEYINDTIGTLLEQTEDINPADVLINIFSDEAYQGFLQGLLNNEFLYSDESDDDEI